MVKTYKGKIIDGVPGLEGMINDFNSHLSLLKKDEWRDPRTPAVVQIKKYCTNLETKIEAKLKLCPDYKEAILKKNLTKKQYSDYLEFQRLKNKKS